MLSALLFLLSFWLGAFLEYWLNSGSTRAWRDIAKLYKEESEAQVKLIDELELQIKELKSR